MKTRFLSILMVMAFCAPFASAQNPKPIILDSVTTGSVTLPSHLRAGNTTSVVVAWTSNADGGVVARLTGIYGTVVRVVSNPDDVTSPTTYSLVLSDKDGVNLLDPDGDGSVTAMGASLSPSATVSMTPYAADASGAPYAISPTVFDILNMTIASAGDAKKGVVTIYLRQ